jgi:hypothetical protein
MAKFSSKKIHVSCFEEQSDRSEGPVGCPGVLKKKLKQDIVSVQNCFFFYL